MLDICFEILDNSPTALKNSEMDIAKRADPVYVSRTITAMVSKMSHITPLLQSGSWVGCWIHG